MLKPPVNTPPDLRGSQDELEALHAWLEQHVPPGAARAIRWLRDPRARPVRLPLGVMCVAAGMVGPFVPVLGVEFIPLGLLLLAEDVPALRKPVADMAAWLHETLQVRAEPPSHAAPAAVYATPGAADPEANVLHETRTRIRLRLPAGTVDLPALEQRISAVHGVSSVRVNGLARCAVVEYDGRTQTRQDVLALARPGRAG